MIPKRHGEPTDRFPELNNPCVRIIGLSILIIICIILILGWLTI